MKQQKCVTALTTSDCFQAALFISCKHNNGSWIAVLKCVMAGRGGRALWKNSTGAAAPSKSYSTVVPPAPAGALEAADPF